MSLTFLFYLFIGSVLGLLVGALPGISVTLATSLLLSLTVSWPFEAALGLMLGVYVVGVYAGAISAILFNIPGAPSSVVTLVDGHALCQRGQARRALRLAADASAIGSLLGIVLLAVAIGPLTHLALLFRPLDTALLCVFSLCLAAGVGAKGWRRGLAHLGLLILGLFFAQVGTNPMTGAVRYTLGLDVLQAGLPTIPVLIGLFGLAAGLEGLWGRMRGPRRAKPKTTQPNEVNEGPNLAGLAYLWGLRRLIGLSALVGGLVGALPGAGGPLASTLAYGLAKRQQVPAEVPYGEGAPEGLLASEVANNACVGGAFVPLLSLAIPGDAVTAILLAAFQLHGLRPGPLFLAEQGGLMGMLLVGLVIATFFLWLMGHFLVPGLGGLLRLPETWLWPLVLGLCYVGTYLSRGQGSDLLIMTLFGVLGFGIRLGGLSLMPFVLAFLLGPGLEQSLGRALALAQASPAPFLALFGHPTTLVLALGLLAVAGHALLKRRN